MRMPRICQIREVRNVPVIMVSAKKDDIDKIRGLGLGADDYMTKPFSPSELVARVKAHMARYERLIGSNAKENEIIEIRGIRIDKTARRVYINGEEKTFTTTAPDNPSPAPQLPSRPPRLIFCSYNLRSALRMRPAARAVFIFPPETGTGAEGGVQSGDPGSDASEGGRFRNMPSDTRGQKCSGYNGFCQKG